MLRTVGFQTEGDCFQTLLMEAFKAHILKTIEGLDRRALTPIYTVG